MKTLGIHSKGFRFESKEKAIEGAETVGMPFRGLAMPRLTSRRPSFYG